MASPVACVFPTYPMRRLECRHAALPGFPEVVQRLASRASAVVPVTPRTFDVPPASQGDGPEETLRAQYACYIEGVAMGEWLAQRYPSCESVAGYSMGLFAALCHAGAVSFEDGLTLIHGVCLGVHAVVPAGTYAMGAVAGLTEEAVRRVVTERCPRVEVIDIYGRLTVIVSGRREDVGHVLDGCVKLGATYTKRTPVTAPFHSSALAPVAPLIFDLLRSVSIKVPRCNIVSSLTQAALATEEEIRVEVAHNVSRAMNWYATMRRLIGLKATLLLECGTSLSLADMARRDLPDLHAAQDFRDYERLFAVAR